MEDTEELRLATCRDDGGGSDGKVEVSGEKPARDGLLGEGLWRCEEVNTVEMGVKRRPLWC